MRKMLQQYYFRNMSTTLLIIPFPAFFYISISLLFDQSAFAFSFGLIASVIIIILNFLQFLKDNEKMFSVMPIPKIELVRTKFIFLLKVAVIYESLFFSLYLFMMRIEKGWNWSGWATAAGIALVLSLLIVNMFLLIHHLPSQKTASVIMPVLAFGLIYRVFILPFQELRIEGILFNGSMLVLVFSAICLVTWLNYRLAIYFVSKIDMS